MKNNEINKLIKIHKEQKYYIYGIYGPEPVEFKGYIPDACHVCVLGKPSITKTISDALQCSVHGNDSHRTPLYKYVQLSLL